MPVCTGLPHDAAELLVSAWQCMRYAERVADANLRFSLAYRSAVKMAAAVLAARVVQRDTYVSAPVVGSPSVWSLIRAQTPSLREWAEYYSCQWPVAQAAESGASGITPRMADDAVRDSAQFIHDAVAVLKALLVHQQISTPLSLKDAAAG